MMDPNSQLRKWLFMAGGVVCLLTAFGLVSTFKGRFPSDPPSVQTSRTLSSKTESAADEFADNEQPDKKVKSEKCVIYITGAVVHPGVYEVPQGSRVDDAVRAAGGFSGRADPEAVNLAARIEDEEHIKIPARAEPQRAAPSQPKSPPGTADSPGAPKPAKSSKAGKSQVAEGKIDINRASASELMALPGIGPKLSQTIVDYRDANGAFQNTEDIRKVKGIGQKRFEAIREMITTGK